MAFELLKDLGGHQINQRKNEHPNQVDEMPVETGDLDVRGVVDLGLKPQDDGTDDRGKQQHMGAVVEGAVSWSAQPSRQPKDKQDGNEIAAQSDDAEVDDPQRHVEHMHSRKAEERGGELRNGFRHVYKLGRRLASGRLGEDREGQPLRDEFAPLASVQK